jgi:hypothetical protein
LHPADIQPLVTEWQKRIERRIFLTLSLDVYVKTILRGFNWLKLRVSDGIPITELVPVLITLKELGYLSQYSV